MEQRDQAAQANDFSNPVFDAAKQFAAADVEEILDKAKAEILADFQA